MDFLRPEWLSLLVSVVVAVGACVGFVVSRRDVREARKDASTATESATAALAQSRRMADSQEAMVVAIGAISNRTDSLEELLAKRFPMPEAAWEIRYRRGDSYDLQNIGKASAYEVDVVSDNAVAFRGPDQVAEWKAGASEKLLAVGSQQTGTPRIMVRWRSTAIDPKLQEWSSPVPPKR